MAALLFIRQKGYLMDSECILILIVHGWNGWARRAMVADLIVQECVSLRCIQDTKLDVPDQSIICNMLGSRFDYVALPTTGTRGGIIIAWHSEKWYGSNA
jgi:hypothetical protein